MKSICGGYNLRSKNFANLVETRNHTQWTGKNSSLKRNIYAPNRVLFSTSSSMETFSAKDVQIERTKTPKTKSPPNKLIFGREFTDHMFEVDWDKNSGWAVPKILPYHPLSLDPSCMVFQYSSECFEGMKAYRDEKGNIRLFRPNKNHERITRSAERMALPKFSFDDFLTSLKTLIKVDKDWVPHGRGYSLYIRPTLIGTQNSLGVGPSGSAKFYIILSPVGPYYPEGWKAVKLLADERFVRAWPGGTGSYKLGSNYATGILPQIEAAKRGYSQILWLFNDQVTEAGTMNFFAFWKNEKGEKELITAPLDEMILAGVTRDSILQLTRQWGEFKVTERKFTMAELAKAIEQSRLIEAFGAGTAAVVSPIKGICYKEKELAIPLNKEDPSQSIGPLTKKIADAIMDIQYGITPSDWSVLI